jgi:hypothetical protein
MKKSFSIQRTSLPTRRTLKRSVARGEGGLSVALGFGAAHGVHSTSRSAHFADGFASVRDPVQSLNNVQTPELRSRGAALSPSDAERDGVRGTKADESAI